MNRIRKAAEAAGALSFIEKQASGFDTQIQAASAVWSAISKIKPDGPLQKRIKELEEEVNVSGGQWQRLAIARSFMRVGHDNEGANPVKLMCYDEPSSALDPKAEFGAFGLITLIGPILNPALRLIELFEKLRTERGNRTLIFITQYVPSLLSYSFEFRSDVYFLSQSITADSDISQSMLISSST